MSLNRDHIHLILEKIVSANQAQQQEFHQAQSQHDAQVSNLQAQNFFRRNKPKVIIAGTSIFGLALLSVGLIALNDYNSLPNHRKYDNTPDPYSERKSNDLGVGLGCSIVGSLLFVLSLMSVYFYRNLRTLPLSGCDPMPELPIPASNITAKNKLSDHFTIEQTEKLIRLCMQMADSMDPHLEIQEKKRFNLFFPNISDSMLNDRFQARVQEIQKKLTLDDAIATIQKFNSFIQEKKLSPKNEKLMTDALEGCISFCKAYDEATPLLNIRIN